MGYWSVHQGYWLIREMKLHSAVTEIHAGEVVIIPSNVDTKRNSSNPHQSVPRTAAATSPCLWQDGKLSLLEGLKPAMMPALVIGVQHDVPPTCLLRLFPGPRLQ